MAPGTPNSILVLIYTSPPIFIKIGPKLPKFATGVVFGVVGTQSARFTLYTVVPSG